VPGISLSHSVNFTRNTACTVRFCATVPTPPSAGNRDRLLDEVEEAQLVRADGPIAISDPWIASAAIFEVVAFRDYQDSCRSAKALE
jgi:hypothetical protein